MHNSKFDFKNVLVGLGASVILILSVYIGIITLANFPEEQQPDSDQNISVQESGSVSDTRLCGLTNYTYDSEQSGSNAFAVKFDGTNNPKPIFLKKSTNEIFFYYNGNQISVDNFAYLEKGNYVENQEPVKFVDVIYAFDSIFVADTAYAGQGQIFQFDKDIVIINQKKYLKLIKSWSIYNPGHMVLNNDLIFVSSNDTNLFKFDHTKDNQFAFEKFIDTSEPMLDYVNVDDSIVIATSKSLTLFDVKGNSKFIYKKYGDDFKNGQIKNILDIEYSAEMNVDNDAGAGGTLLVLNDTGNQTAIMLFSLRDNNKELSFQNILETADGLYNSEEKIIGMLKDPSSNQIYFSVSTKNGKGQTTVVRSLGLDCVKLNIIKKTVGLPNQDYNFEVVGPGGKRTFSLNPSKSNQKTIFLTGPSDIKQTLTETAASGKTPYSTVIKCLHTQPTSKVYGYIDLIKYGPSIDLLYKDNAVSGTNIKEWYCEVYNYNEISRENAKNGYGDPTAQGKLHITKKVVSGDKGRSYKFDIFSSGDPGVTHEAYGGGDGFGLKDGETINLTIFAGKDYRIFERNVDGVYTNPVCYKNLRPIINKNKLGSPVIPTKFIWEYVVHSAYDRGGNNAILLPGTNKPIGDKDEYWCVFYNCDNLTKDLCDAEANKDRFQGLSDSNELRDTDDSFFSNLLRAPVAEDGVIPGDTNTGPENSVGKDANQ